MADKVHCESKVMGGKLDFVDGRLVERSRLDSGQDDFLAYKEVDYADHDYDRLYLYPALPQFAFHHAI